ncbi:MAG TPA: phosphate acyltransferase PlsX [Holophagaceae bacterium]|nr:phosphate acyltransferase PlsX [Holophagaceae bacterium]
MTGARIALDVMGGDHAPQATLAGAKDALKRFPSLRLLLVGDEAQLKPLLAHHGLEGPLASRFEVVHAGSVVDFHDEPKVILKEKKDSSVRVCAQLVREGKADGMVSMGHTGAAMMASTLVIGKLDGVDRPALAGLMPNGPGKFTILTDVGANIDSRPDHIAGFALMASIYAEQVLGLERPRVGIMSVGEEDSKGTEITLAAHALLKEMDLNFQGNAEGRDLWNGRFDVITCDGYVGNVVLKSAEGLGRMLKQGITGAIKSNVRAMLGGLLVQPALKGWFKQLDYREYGGLPLLGIKGVSIIGHGSSDARAVMNGIGAALRAIDHQLVPKIAARMAPAETPNS